MSTPPSEPDAIARSLMHQPTPQEALTAAQINQAIEWLQKKWGADRSCPYCGTSSWRVGGPMQILAAFVTPYGKGALSPAFTVMCANCGHTSLVNSIVAGITKEGDPQ